MDIKINREPIDKIKAVNDILSKLATKATIGDDWSLIPDKNEYTKAIDEIYKGEQGPIQSIEFHREEGAYIEVISGKDTCTIRHARTNYSKPETYRSLKKPELTKFIQALKMIEAEMA